MLTETQKQIYNFYLKAYRVNNDLPFRPKKNFDKFEEKEEYIYVLKLDTFFKKFPHLFKLDFFNAPYKIYNDDKKFYDLKYFSSYRGLQTCVEYYKVLAMSNPDEQMDFIKESLRFIIHFCLEKNIELRDYCLYKSVTQNDFLKHLKEHNISWFLVFVLPHAMDILYKMEDDEFGLYFGTSINLNAMQVKFSSSKKARKYLEKMMKKIPKFLENKSKM